MFKKPTVWRALACFALALLCLFCLLACNKVDATGSWEDAIYLKDTTLGKGEKTVTVKVAADDQEITFTIRTDKDTLREVMEEHELISGEDGPYGLYVQSVNGIRAVYEEGGYYWQITKNGEMLPTGVDSVTVADGEQYEFTKTK